MKPRNERMLRCAIYTRKSSEEGLEQDFNSLHAQREACEAYIRSQQGEGWRLHKTSYDDGGLSGATMERPALKQLLADIEDGLVDVVVVYKVDRLTRSLSDFARMVEIFDGHQVSFVAVTQQFNTTTSMGRLTLNVLLSFAQFEREVTDERIRDKIAASKRKGMWMGGLVPIGYEVHDRQLTIVASEADTVRQIFQRYCELGSVRLLKEDLGRKGCRSKLRISSNGVRSGEKSFARGALYTLLRNPIYIGEIRHQGARYPGQHQPILERAVWEKTQELLLNHTVRTKSKPREPSPSPLIGKLFDETGDRLTPTHAVKGNRRYRYYVSSSLMKGASPKSGQGSLPLDSSGKPADAKARLMLEKAIALDPNYAEAYAVLGWNYLDANELLLSPDTNSVELAFQMGQQAIARDDSLPVAHTLLAALYNRKGQLDQAASEAQRSIALDPNDAEGYNQLATIMDSMGKPAEALVAAEKAIRLDPLHVAYRYLLGDAYTQLGRYEEAIPVLKSDLAFSDLLWDHVDLVRDYSELGKEDAARAEAVEVERRSALTPNSPEGYLLLALALDHMGEPAQALVAVQKAMYLDPQNRDNYLIEEGFDYLALGRYGDALGAFKRHVALHPGISWDHLGLAAAYIELGRDDAAHAEAAEVLRLNPQFSLKMVVRTVGPKGKVLANNIRASTDLRKAGLQ